MHASFYPGRIPRPLFGRPEVIFPPVLRLVSRLLPNEFPYDLNWKMSRCHPAFCELFPTMDHVIPVSRGGTANLANLVCTSMLHNSAKANWTLEELGWKLHPLG